MITISLQEKYETSLWTKNSCNSVPKELLVDQVCIFLSENKVILFFVENFHCRVENSIVRFYNVSYLHENSTFA